MTIRLVAYTQDWENYGENGQARWKAKGGIEVIIANLTVDEACRGQAVLQRMVDMARPIVDHKCDDFERTIIGWSLVFDGELTNDERLQMEFDGKITNPPFTLENLIKRRNAA